MEKNNKGKSLILRKVNLISCNSNEVRDNMAIVIRDGLIEEVVEDSNLSIPEDATILNLPGKTVIPGLIDCHVHLFQSGVNDFLRPYAEKDIVKFKRSCELTIQSGVTTVRNMPGGCNKIFKYKNKVDSGKIIGPRILASGPAITVPYSYFSKLSYIPFNSFIRSLLEPIIKIRGLSIDVHTKKDVPIVVNELKKQGVDFIKTITPESNYPFAKDEKIKQKLLKKGLKEELIEASMDYEILRDIVGEAHKLDLKVACHNIYGTDGFSQAVEAGVDSIEHSPMGLISNSVFDLMKENNTFWVPTAFCFYNWKNFIDKPEAYNKNMKNMMPKSLQAFGRDSLEKVREDISEGGFWNEFYNEVELFKQNYFPSNLNLAIKKGVKICAGVDCGAGGAGYVPHGQLYKELELYVHNGMDEFDALKTATINPAELIGKIDEVGSIEKGKIGDMVVLERNPMDNISNLRSVKIVIKDGEIVFRKDQ